ncbi:SDR family oxidoreductase [Marinobacterium sedimentorum]|uniref:SDR family oxidoreductase n=1 Tax=Marinobacterium sedimentorum TaxID=2927804 RepID=UPI0020C6226D|nr:SDR family oxidoreductase [Marinobacterium sedimentorum]MCP8688711.1 SDR family oxidoreductase [Marinobacterium sedimentorum]
MLKNIINQLIGKKKMSKPILLIIGAAGNNGVATIKSLTEKHQDRFTIRAGVRSQEKADTLTAQFPGIETTILDLDKPETLSAAFEGVQELFLILGNVENREQQAKHAIDAAVAAGTVEHVLFYSVVGAEYEAILFAKQFRAGEKYLEASGLKWTHLRTIFFQENFAGWAEGIKQGTLYFGVRDGQFAPLSITDIGEIAANIMATEGHEGQAYNITGPELLSGQDIAKVFSDVTGKSVGYVSPDEATTLASLLDSGWPEWQAKGLLELLDLFASNQAAVVSPDGEKLLGRPLTKLSGYAQANKALFI